VDAAIDSATAPAGAIEVTDWNRTSRNPMAPRDKVTPLLAMMSSFGLLPKVINRTIKVYKGD
jgi:hypothetical protein